MISFSFNSVIILIISPSSAFGVHNLVRDKDTAYSKVFIRLPWVSTVPFPVKVAKQDLDRSHGPARQGSLLSTGESRVSGESSELRDSPL